jgi:hypothetical protein
LAVMVITFPDLDAFHCLPAETAEIVGVPTPV